MSVTATQLAYRALRDLGCLRPGQTTSTDVLNDVLSALNERIDSDLLNPLMAYAFRPDIFNLTAGTQVYQIGPGQAPPNFNAPRPVDIYAANVILNNVTPNVRIRPLTISVQGWSAIKVRAIPSAIPLELYYDKNFDPTGQFATINLWPGPLTSYQLELFTSQQLQQFPDLTTALNWPPGYVNYLRKNVAVEIAPMMQIYNKLARLEKPAQSLLQLVMQQAKDAKEAIESDNAQDWILSCDAAFLTGAGGAWNYGLGEARRG